MFGNGPESGNTGDVPEYPLSPHAEVGNEIEPYPTQVPDHDALIIREGEDGEYSGEATFIVPPLDEMSPSEQEAWLLAAAFTTAENGRPEASLDARVAASELLPPEDPLFGELHGEVAQLNRGRVDRALIMAELSKRPYSGAHDAWMAAFDAGRQIGRILGGHENPHVLELITDGQSDPLRLADIKWAAENTTEDRWIDPKIQGDIETLPYVKARIKKAVVKQQIKAGLMADAAVTFASMPRDSTSVHRDEAAVHLTEAVARTRTGDSVDSAVESLEEISHDHMRTWGQIKIGKYNERYADQTQYGIEHKLPQDWRLFTIKQRQTIVRDYIEAGDLHPAATWANQIADPRHSTVEERRAQTESVVEVAYREAEDSPYIAVRNLREARSEAAQRLAQIKRGGVGETGGTRRITPGERASANLLTEYTDRVNMLAVHTIAARVHIDPDTALAAMRDATFIGSQPAVYESRIRRAVAGQLARVGRIEQAASIASEIPDDTDYDSQKSQAFIAIARSVRQRRTLGQ